MRKILSLVLVLALVLGSFAFTFAATPSDVVGEDSEDAVNVLMELGVINGYPDGSYKPAGIVTRGEMAKIVICALGLEDYAAGSSSFSDMAGHWSDKYVAYAVSLGIINGYPDGTFKADNTVSYDEAAKMLVAALGYTEDSLVGAWPVNYVTKAKVLGILDDIKAGSAGANRGDIAIMTYQTLDLPIGKTNNDGDWIASIPADDMLTRLGAVLAAGGAAFVLTDTHADDAIADVRELVGAFVKAYVNDDGEIIAIKSVESEFLIGEFDLATVAAATTFETDDEEYDIIGFASLVAAGYYTNGESDPLGFGVADVAAATEYKIAVDVSGVKINDIYSVAEWAIDDDFQFEDGDLEDDNIAGNTFKLDDNDDIDMSSFVLLGVDSLEDIEEDDVVYVYLGGTSGDVTKIEVGTDTDSGVVTRIKSGDYTIGGKVYSFATAFAGTLPSIDDEIDMVLDYAGDIYDYEIVSGESDLYAIVLRTGVASEDMSALGASDAEIELFLADGTKDTFVVDYDEIGTANIPATIYDTTTSPDTWLIGAGDVIEYALTKDGEIKSIEWVVDASTLTAMRADTNGPIAATDLTAKGYFDGYGTATDALIFTYDVAGFTTDEDDYSVADRAALLDSAIPNNAFYVLDSGVIVFMYIDGGATATDDVFGVLVDAEENSSDAGWGVDMLIDGVEVFKNSNVDYTAAAMDLLYLVEYDVDGDVSLLTGLTLVPGAVYNKSARTATANTGTCSVSGNVVSVTTVGDSFDIDGAASTFTDVTLDADVAVYEWNDADGVYDVARISDIKGMAEVAFFDTVDDDGVFDIVLIMDDNTGVLPY